MKRALLALLVGGAVVLGALLASAPVGAAIDDDVFTSREADVRMLAPRGWRVSDQRSYPGVLLWMVRAQPPGEMLLTVEDIGPASRACWPQECGRDPTVPGFVCVLSSRLKAAGFDVGPVEDGRWFDYQRSKRATRFLRQGVVVLGHHAFTLVLATPTAADRATHARAFDRALRSLRPLSSSGEGGDLGSGVTIDGGDIDAAAGAAAGDAPAAPTDGGTPTDGGEVAPAVAPIDGGAPRPDGGVPVVEDVPPCRAPAPAPAPPP